MAVVGMTLTSDFIVEIVRKNDKEALKNILENEIGRKAISDIRSHDGGNALMIACYYYYIYKIDGEVDTDNLNILIDSGLFDPGYTNTNGETALMIACNNYNLKCEKGKKIISKLIAFSGVHVGIHRTDYLKNDCALRRLIGLDHHYHYFEDEILEMIATGYTGIENENNNITDIEYLKSDSKLLSSSLVYACELYASSKVVMAILDVYIRSNKTNWAEFCKTDSSSNPLRVSVNHAHLAEVSLTIISMMNDANTSFNYAMKYAGYQRGLLYQACYAKNAKVVFAILNTPTYKKIDDHLNEFEEILCICNLSKELDEVSLYLIELSEGGTRFSLDKYIGVCGGTPLMGASRKGSEKIILALIATGKVNINYSDVNGSTPMKHLIDLRMNEMIRAFIASGVSDYATYRDIYGRSYLTYAIVSRNKEATKMFIATGAFDLRSEPFTRRILSDPYFKKENYRDFVMRSSFSFDDKIEITDAIAYELSIADEVSRRFALIKMQYEKEVEKRLADKIAVYEGK